MKQGWTLRKLGDLCKLTRGHNPPKSKFINVPRDGYVRFYQIRDGWADNYVVYVPDSPQLHKVDPDDILMVAYRHIGKVFRGVTGAFNVALCKISNRNDEVLDSDYLFYIIPTEVVQGELMKRSERSLIPSMSVEHLKEIEIPLPPINEQRLIVSILNNAFEVIEKAKANAEQNLKNARELFESYLQNMFEYKGESWEEKTLGEVLKKTESIDPTKRPNEEFIYLDVSSVNKDTKEIENSTLLIGKDAPSRARKLVRTNDVIFATVRPTHGRAALITEEYNEQVCSTGYLVLRTKEFLNNNLVFYFLLTYGFNKQMEKLQKGASYPAVTDSEVKSIEIRYPKSLKEQKYIVQQLDAMSIKTKKLEAIYKHKLADLEELKKSLLQKAFNGELKMLEPVEA